jgi:hypothetical protein
VEPFRFKSDLRNHQLEAIVQPRLYDCLMVTQITLLGPARGPRGVPCRAAAASRGGFWGHLAAVLAAI